MAAESMPFFSRTRKPLLRYVNADTLLTCSFPLTVETVGNYHGDILQRRHHNYQALDLAALPPAFPTPSTQNHPLECRLLRHKLLVDHHFTDHLSMPSDSRGLGSVCQGAVPPVKRGVHRIGHM